MGLRATRKRLLGKIHERIRQDSQLVAAHESKKWTRRWSLVGQLAVRLMASVGAVIILGAIACTGLMLNGLIDVGRWVGNRQTFRPPVAPILAGWCLFGVSGLIGAALNIRQNPISIRYRPWASNMPISDRRLVRPFAGILAMLASATVVLALGAFVFPAFMLEWPPSTILRYAVMVLLTIVTSWLLADLLAAFLPPTPMIQTVSTLLLLGGCVVGIGFAVTPRDVLEVRQLQSYEALWVLPPAGWYIGLTGLWPGNWLREYFFPLLGISVCLIAGRRMFRGLELEDIQMVASPHQPAYRRGWLRSWTRPRKDGAMAEAAEKPEKLRELLSKHREESLATPEPSWIDRFMFPFRLSSRQLAILGLLGVRYPRLGQWKEFLSGCWPVPFCLGLLVLNQFMPLIAIPRYLRTPLMIGFTLSLVNFQEYTAAYSRGNVSLGFAAARSIFPFSSHEIFLSLLWNRLILFWSLIPGWSVAIAVLLFTDTPLGLVLGTPILLFFINLLLPLYCTIIFISGNLRSSWQTWLLVITPWSILTMIAWICFLFGVAGFMLALRVDLATAFMAVVAALICLGAAIFSWSARKLRMDESTTPLSQAIKRI